MYEEYGWVKCTLFWETGKLLMNRGPCVQATCNELLQRPINPKFMLDSWKHSALYWYSFILTYSIHRRYCNNLGPEVKNFIMLLEVLKAIWRLRMARKLRCFVSIINSHYIPSSSLMRIGVIINTKISIPIVGVTTFRNNFGSFKLLLLWLTWRKNFSAVALCEEQILKKMEAWNIERPSAIRSYHSCLLSG